MVRCRLRMVVMGILATVFCYTIISHVSPDPPPLPLLLEDKLINNYHRQKERLAPELPQIENDRSVPALHPKESLRAPPINEKALSSTPNSEPQNPVETIENIRGDNDGEPEIGGGELVEGMDIGNKVHAGIDETENVGGEEIDIEDPGGGIFKPDSMKNEGDEDNRKENEVESKLDIFKNQLEKLQGNEVDDIQRKNNKVNIEAYVKSAGGTMDRSTPAGFVDVGRVNPKPTKKPIKKVEYKKPVPMLDPKNDPYTRTKLIERGEMFANISAMGAFVREQNRRAKNIINICKTFEIQHNNREWPKVVNTERLDPETVKRLINIGLIRQQNDGGSV
ncbi:unnamed protein product, partial [Meganyctiphanes norvegica]